MSKITVYENVDFNQVAGKQVEFEIGVHDEDHLAREGIGVNKTSSLKVPEGLQVEVFSGQHYDGKGLFSITVNINISDHMAGMTT